MGSGKACSACGAGVPAEARFCGACGSALAATCARCGSLEPPEGSFCTKCGAALGTQALEKSFASPETYTPSALAEKIREGRTAIQGERKQITVLFADVAGFTTISEKLDPEDTHAIMQRCFDIMLAEVHRYEGTVSQFLGDGMLALFGAPISHEDHAQRAIRAGLGIQLALTRYQEELRARGIDFRMRIGLNSGPVVVGSVATDLRMEYTAVGDTVNLASRMETLAEPGTVVISENTFKLVAGYFVVRDLGPREIKGKELPVRVYEVLEPSRSRSRIDVSIERGLGPYVGRRSELDTLVERFNEARLEHGQIVFVSGEAGLGKSRLLHELRRRLEGAQLTWLTGRCISYGAEISYLPIIDLLKDGLAVEESDPEEDVARKIEEWFAASRTDPAHLPYLRYLLSIDPGDQAVASGDPQIRKARVFDAVRSLLLASAAAEPTVIAIEDLHWIDQLSLELVSYIADVVPDHAILLMLTHRPDWDPPFRGRASITRIELPSLTEVETAQVAESAVGAGGLPPELRDVIHRKAEGNPFFAEEVSKSLVEVGAIRRSGSGYVLARPVEEIFVPDTVQDVIMARLDRLPEDPRRALQTASVIGREFTARLLERTADMGSASGSSLSQLKSVQLIYERSLYPELEYMFKHALTHDVAYNSLLLQRRRSLHGLVGDAIEELYGDRLVEHYETLAHHYERAERWDKAFNYLLRSCEKSLGAFAPRAAADFGRRAMRVLSQPGVRVSPDRRIALHEQLGHAFELLSDWPRCTQSFEDMVEAVRETGDRGREGVALWTLAFALFFAHRFEEAVGIAEQALDVAAETGDPAVTAGSLFTISYVRAATGDLEAAVATNEDVLRLAREARDPLIEAWALLQVGEVRHWRGEEEAALESMTAAVAVGREHEIAATLLWGPWDRGLALCGSGRYDEALAALQEAMDLSAKLGDKAVRCRTLNTLGWVYMDLCNWELATEHNRMASEESRAFGDPEIIRNSELNLADCLLAAGDLGGADGLLEAVERESEQTGAWGQDFMKWRYSQHLHASLAALWLARGDPERAIASADLCIAAAEATGARRNVTKGRRARGEALLALGRIEDADADIEAALEAAAQVSNPAQLRETLVARGRVRIAQGRVADAAEAYREALEGAEAVAASLSDARLRDALLGSREVSSIREDLASVDGTRS